MSDLIDRAAAIDAVDRAVTKEAARWSIQALPSAQSERTEERTETHACDLISRQAAIGIERNATVDTNPMHFEAHQKFTQFMDDAEISSFGRWQWSNGFNTALTAVGIDLKKLPSAQPYSEADIQKMQDLEQAELQKAYECGRASAQPEIIRCKECKHYYEGGWYCSAWNNSPGFPIVTEEGYCNLAERRTG